LSESIGKKLFDQTFGTVFENDAKDHEHYYTGLGYKKLIKFKVI
jgi:hypothetical protein